MTNRRSVSYARDDDGRLFPYLPSHIISIMMVTKALASANRFWRSSVQRIPRLMAVLCALVLVCIRIVPHTVAQTLYSPWTVFTVADGLAANEVYDIAQDRLGVLWLATDAGVSRYDGRWQTFDAAKGLVSNRVRSVLPASNGDYWFGTLNGVSRLRIDDHRGPTWSSFTSQNSDLLGDSVNTILEATDGSIWFGTQAGIARWRPTDGGKGEWSAITTADGLTSGAVYALMQDQAGVVWAGTAGGVARYDGQRWQTVVPDAMAPFGRTNVIAQDRQGRMWFMTEGSGIFRFEPAANVWTHWTTADGLSDNSVWSFVQDVDGTYWFGTNFGGVARFDETAVPAEQWSSYQARGSGLSANSVRAIWEDRQDSSLWFATTSGLDRFDRQHWYTVPNSKFGGRSTPIYALAAPTDGQLWVGTQDAGLVATDGKQWFNVPLTIDGVPGEVVVAGLLRDRDGAMWVGTNGNGLLVQKDGVWSDFSQQDGLAGSTVRAIAQDLDGSYWLGTFAGLSHYQPAVQSVDGGSAAQWTTYTTADGLPSDHIQALHVDRAGRVWVGTNAGLARLAAGAWQTYTSQNSLLPASDIRAILEAQDGSLWFGTWASGVVRHDPAVDTWTTLTVADGLVANGVLALIQDHRGVLWFGTEGGVSRFDGETWRNYQTADGLVGNFVISLYEDAAGQIWIGTRDGLSRYRPDPHVPWSRIQTITGILFEDAPVVLQADSPVSINFIGGDFNSLPGSLVYRYRLLPTNPDWLTTRSLSVRYPALTAGDYTFEVQALDQDLNYSQPATASITVQRSVPRITIPGTRITMERPTFFGFLGLTTTALVATIMGATVYYQGRRRPRKALERKFNPYVSGEPVRRGDMFFGRRELLNRILSILHNNSVMIHGERRIGKTSMLFQLADHLREVDDPDYHFIPIMIDLEGTPEREFFHRIMEATIDSVTPSVLVGLSLAYQPIQAEYTARDLRRDLRLIINRLQETETRTVRLILLIDEVDAMNEYDQLTQQQLRRIFMEHFAQNLGAVVAGVHVSKEWDRMESPWFNLFNEVELTPFGPHEARALLKEPVRGIYTWREDAIQFVIDHADGRPHRLQQYALEAVNHMIAARRTEITLRDAQAAHEAILHMLET